MQNPQFIVAVEFDNDIATDDAEAMLERIEEALFDIITDLAPNHAILQTVRAALHTP